MFNFETVTPVGHEAERVITAFYRFLELRTVPQGADIAVHTEILGSRQRCIVRLWNEDAVKDFGKYLDQFRTPRPAGLPVWLGYERLDQA